MKYSLYTLIILFFTVLIIDLVLGLIIKLPNPYAHLRYKTNSTGEVIRLQNKRNRDAVFLFRPNELFPKNEPHVIDIHINNFGFRHTDDIDSLRDEVSIYAIGGSTTQGYDYPYEKTWCQVLESKLEKQTNKEINVYNGGTAGAALFDHLALLQNRVIHLNPDMVILFSGVNDLNVLLGDNNIYRFDDIYESTERVSWIKLLLGKSTLFRLMLNARKNLEIKDVEPEEEEERPKTALPEDLPIHFADHIKPSIDTQNLPLGDDISLNHSYYANMVKAFIGICKANDIPVMVMTQPTTWKSDDQVLQKYHWMNKNRTTRFSKDFTQAAMDRMNDDVASLALKLETPVFRLENYIPNNGEYFFDDCHFTPKGSLFVGESVFNFIIENNLIPSEN